MTLRNRSLHSGECRTVDDERCAGEEVADEDEDEDEDEVEVEQTDVDGEEDDDGEVEDEQGNTPVLSVEREGVPDSWTVAELDEGDAHEEEDDDDADDDVDVDVDVDETEEGTEERMR